MKYYDLAGNLTEKPDNWQQKVMDWIVVPLGLLIMSPFIIISLIIFLPFFLCIFFWSFFSRRDFETYAKNR